jgi:putative ABC transport system permease protein
MFQDLRYGIRMLLRDRTFTLAAIIALALGIGATTAIFSVVNGVLLRPLPYAQAERTVLVWGNFLKLNITQLQAKAAEYVDYRDRTQSFAQVAAFNTSDLTLTGSGEPERLTGARVTANLFPMLGAVPLHGRVIADEETQSGRGQVVVISHAFWQHRMGGTPSAIGQSLRLNDANYTIIGVMPAEFAFPHSSFNFSETADLWLPLVLDAEAVAQRGGPWDFNVLAQLKPEVTLAQAQAEMNTLAEHYDRVLGFKSGYRGPNGEDGGWRITVVPLQEQVVGASRRALWILFGTVGLILLIACANVANLLLVRATVRQKELAIRAALGAGRARLVRQLLVESLLLAGLGGALGAWLAWWGLKAIVLLSPATLPRAAEVTLDGRVLGFTLLVSLLTGVLFGLAPAWQASKLDLQETLQEGGTQRTSGQRRWREWLVVAEVALALPLLIGAGLLFNSFVRVLRAPTGVMAEQTLVAELNLPDTKYGEPVRAAAFFGELAQRVAALPGVAVASYSTRPILSNVTSSDPFSIEGRPMDIKQPNFAGWQRVAPDYFRTLGIPLVAGRDFTASDEAGAPVALINEALAQRYFPTGDAIGQRITLGAPRPSNPYATIIGIVKDIPHRNVESPAKPEIFLGFARQPHLTAWFYVRVAGEPTSFAPAIRQTVLAIDRDQPVKSIQPLPTVIATTMAPRRFTTWLLGGFALLALILAALGIYSVNAYAVAQRTQEIGIRMALGAQVRDVLRLILQRGLTLVLAGLALGMLVSLAVTRWLKSLLFSVSATDPLTYGGVTLLLLLIALLACYLPARRAAKVDPMKALRHE